MASLTAVRRYWYPLMCGGIPALIKILLNFSSIALFPAILIFSSFPAARLAAISVTSFNEYGLKTTASCGTFSISSLSSLQDRIILGRFAENIFKRGL